MPLMSCWAKYSMRPPFCAVRNVLTGALSSGNAAFPRCVGFSRDFNPLRTDTGPRKGTGAAFARCQVGRGGPLMCGQPHEITGELSMSNEQQNNPRRDQQQGNPQQGGQKPGQQQQGGQKPGQQQGGGQRKPGEQGG